jgi:MFS transporter, FHS family, glucose/mannose:H+ symporter
LTEPGETSFTRAAFAAALGALALAGAIDAAYGPLLRPVTHRFGVSLPVAGTLISINFAGGLAGTLGALAGFTHAPRRPIATFALGVLGLGCLWIAAARGWPALTIGVFLTGAGFGATDFSLNQIGARSGAGRAVRLTLLNAAFGTGAVLGPAAVGWLGLRALTVGFAVAAGWAWVMAAGVLGITTAGPASGGLDDVPERAEGAAGGGAEAAAGGGAEAAAGGGAADETGGGTFGRDNPGRRRAGRPSWVEVLVALAFLLYVGCESGVAGWIPAHLVALGYRSRLATAVTSGFWAAMVVGRLVTAPLSRAVAASRIVLAACPLLTLALALTAVPAMAPACYVTAGFIAAPIWPIGLDWVVAAFPGYRSATSWALTSAFAGGIAGPAAAAGVVSIAGVRAVPVVLTFFAGGTSLAFLAIWRTGRRLLRTPPSTGCGQGAPGTA